MNVTLRQLRAFVAVSQTGSFTDAATSLHITQSALSGLIKELEQTLGVQIVHRTTRKVQLSSMGKEFLPLSARILEDLDSALQAIADLKELRTGVIRVAVPQLMACTLMAETMGAFANAFPRLDVRLTDCDVENVLPKVQSGEVDFGIGPERPNLQDISARRLFDMPFMAVFPPGHPLERLRRPTWADLLGYPVISLKGAYAQMLRTELQAEVGGPGYAPHKEVSFMTTALSMVSAGQGVTVCLPYARSLTTLYGLGVRPLSRPTVRRQFYLLTRMDRMLSPAAQVFADFLVDYVERQKWDAMALPSIS